MKYVNKLLAFFFPETLLSRSELELYNIEDNKFCRSLVLVLTPVFFLLYIVHFFYIDTPKGLPELSNFWYYFRFGCSLTSLITFIFYGIKKVTLHSMYKLPLFLLSTHLITMQSLNVVFDSNGTTFLPYFFILVSILLLRMTTSLNFIFGTFFCYTTSHILVYAGKDISYLISHCLIVFMVTLFLSYRNNLNITLFKTNQENIKVHKKLIEQQIEVLNQIKQFLPSIIYARFENLIESKKISSSEALSSILKPKKMEIVCLFSDIRGFTKKSRDLKSVVNEIIPTISEASNIIESNTGITRKIGDLVFAYFDDYDLSKNIDSALNACIEIAITDYRRKTKTLNRSLILTVGEAIVGNIGGKNAFEITAIGNPANFSARIDEYVKKNIELNKNIILSEAMYSHIRLNHKQYFKKHKIKSDMLIRDFENEETLFVLPFSSTQQLISDNLLNKNNNHAI